MKFSVLSACALLFALSAPAFPQEMQTPPKCASVAAPPPALSGWSSKQDFAAAAKEEGLPPGRAHRRSRRRCDAVPTRDVSFITQPEKPGGSVAHGGIAWHDYRQRGHLSDQSQLGRLDRSAQGWCSGDLVRACARSRLHRHPQDGAVPAAARHIMCCRFPPMPIPPSSDGVPGRLDALGFFLSAALVAATAALPPKRHSLCLAFAAGVAPPPVPADNPMSDAKVALGRRLFYDADLSRDGTTSCATCHEQHRAFTEGNASHPGVGGVPGRRNVMALAMSRISRR